MKKIIYGICAVCFILPIVLTIKNSFSGDMGAFSLYGYDDLLFNCFSFYKAFWNTVLYTAVITFAVLIVIIPAAFVFTQIKSRLMDILLILLIMLMLMPLQVTLLPNYIGLRDMDMLDNPIAIVLPAVFSPIYAVILVQYLHGIDLSVIEAVRLESNSVIRIIVTAVIPQIRPCIFAVIVLAAAESWNMLEQPMYFLKNENLMPLNVFMNKASDWKILYPSAVLSLIPMLLLYVYFGNELKNGISVGGTNEKND